MNTKKKLSYKKKSKKSGNKKLRCSEILGECYRCLGDKEFMNNKGLIFKTQNKIPNEFLDAQYNDGFKPKHILKRDTFKSENILEEVKKHTMLKKKSQKRTSIIPKSIISIVTKKRSIIPKNLRKNYKKMFTSKISEKESKALLSLIPEFKKQNKSDKEIGRKIAESILQSSLKT